MTGKQRASAAAPGPTAPAPPPLTFAVSHAFSTAVVTLHGELDEQAGDSLAALLRGVIHEERNRVVVVDLRSLTGAAEPVAMEVFRAAAGWARGEGVGLQLYGPPAVLSDGLTSAWLGQELDIVP